MLLGRPSVSKIPVLRLVCNSLGHGNMAFRRIAIQNCPAPYNSVHTHSRTSISTISIPLNIQCALQPLWFLVFYGRVVVSQRAQTVNRGGIRPDRKDPTLMVCLCRRKPMWSFCSHPTLRERLLASRGDGGTTKKHGLPFPTLRRPLCPPKET